MDIKWKDAKDAAIDRIHLKKLAALCTLHKRTNDGDDTAKSQTLNILLKCLVNLQKDRSMRMLCMAEQEYSLSSFSDCNWDRQRHR